jgi:hypothetical protein
MRSKITLLLVLALVAVPFQAQAAPHVVSATEVQQALLQAQAQRQADEAAVTAALQTPEAREIAGRMGVNPDRVTAGIATLSDEELRDLAQRSAALTTDPVAGSLTDRNTLLTILIAVAIVYLVIQIVD